MPKHCIICRTKLCYTSNLVYSCCEDCGIVDRICHLLYCVTCQKTCKDDNDDDNDDNDDNNDSVCVKFDGIFKCDTCDTIIKCSNCNTNLCMKKKPVYSCCIYCGDIDYYEKYAYCVTCNIDIYPPIECISCNDNDDD